MTETLRELGYDNLPDLGRVGGLPDHIAQAIAEAQGSRPKTASGHRSGPGPAPAQTRPQPKITARPQRGDGLLSTLVGGFNRAPSSRGGVRRSGHDDHFMLLLLYRGGAIVAGMMGYIIVAAIESKLTNRVLPPSAYPGWMAFVVTVVATAFINGVQTAFRNAVNDDGLIVPVGIAAYFLEFVLILIGMLIGAGYNLPWLPGGGGTVPLTWFDLFLSVGFTALLTVASEPLVEYGFTGLFRPFGRRI
jgi:hypothetical protein